MRSLFLCAYFIKYDVGTVTHKNLLCEVQRGPVFCNALSLAEWSRCLHRFIRAVAVFADLPRRQITCFHLDAGRAGRVNGVRISQLANLKYFKFCRDRLYITF